MIFASCWASKPSVIILYVVQEAPLLNGDPRWKGFVPALQPADSTSMAGRQWPLLGMLCRQAAPDLLAESFDMLLEPTACEQLFKVHDVAGPLPYPAIRPQHGALKPCTSRAEKIAQEQLGAEISRRGGRQGGVLRQSGTSGVSQASSSHVALSERTWSRLRRELGGGSTRTELSSESGSV